MIFRRRKKKRLSKLTVNKSGKIIETKPNEDLTIDSWIELLREGMKVMNAFARLADEEHKKRRENNGNKS